MAEPAFHSVVDLGLRDVGVKNKPRRLAAQFGKTSAGLVALLLVSLFAMCVIAGVTGAGAWLGFAFVLIWPVVIFVLAVRTVKRSPVVVVRVTGEGTNAATWLLIAPSLLVLPAAVVAGQPLLLPIMVFPLIMVVLVWRGRGRVPEVLRELRPLLADGEPVLGDGLGMVPRARRWRDGFRLVVATDRRLLVATSPRSAHGFLLVDVPYTRVSRFGMEWKYAGRAGVLSLDVAGAEGAPSETHVIASMSPANLLSIAQALQAHGVQTDDPAAVSEVERAWVEALQGEDTRRPLFDPTAMSTRGFDHGLWLLLAVSAVAFYALPAEVGFWVLPVVAALCLICGYVAGTRSSLAYIAPLNLLLSPLFFFVDASGVVALMLMISAVAAIGLSAGSALRRTPPASPRTRARRGSLRYAFSGPGLVRISGILVTLVLVLVATAAAAGFELTTLRLAVDEVTAKQLPADGRSNLTGGAAWLTYTPGPNLKEFVTDEDFGVGPNDGARWELRSSFTKGYNVVSLAHYIFEPRLDDPAAVAEFVAGKDREHSKSAGHPVTHTERVVDGRRGYVWTHVGRADYWLYSAWFPQPVHTVRVECVARKQTDRFKRLCAEAIRTLKFQ
jgi:hypothetical protein